MRRASALPAPAPDAAPGAAHPRKSDWATLATLLPYLWKYRGRVLLALVCLVAAKIANVGVPVVLKHIVDALTRCGGNQTRAARELGISRRTLISRLEAYNIPRPLKDRRSE